MKKPQRTGNGLDFYFIVNLKTKSIIEGFRTKIVAIQYKKNNIFDNDHEILTLEEYEKIK